MLIVVVLMMLLVAGAFLTRSGSRGWRNENIALKWVGAGLAAVSAAAVALVSVLMIAGLAKLHARSAPTPVIKVAGTAGQIQRGRAISDSFCGACHSTTVLLTGGLDIGGHFPISCVAVFCVHPPPPPHPLPPVRSPNF